MPNDDNNVKRVSELVRSIGGLPAIALVVLLLFPQAVAGYTLFRLDATMQRLVEAVASLDRSFAAARGPR